MTDDPCHRCGGAGSYSYDHNHAKICEVCCPHGKGWWKLDDEGYGDKGGMWCCLAGCGTVRDDVPEDEKVTLK